MTECSAQTGGRTAPVSTSNSSGRTAVVKYNAGNIHSMTCALQRMGIDPVVTDDPELLRSADRVIFPGVGEASSAMRYLRDHGLDEVIRSLKQPFLGVCLGLQLMCAYSEENDTECLGIFSEHVRRFPPLDKVPHMGWNTIKNVRSSLFSGVVSEEDVGIPSHFYFVHSYYASPGEHTIAECDYIVPFSAALKKDNFFGVQFHPEKSGKIGEQVLRNFMRISLQR